MKLLLCRHGHVEGIDPPRFRGHREVPLTELGRRQANALAELVAQNWTPALIITSPLGRCIETGAAIARRTGAATRLCANFGEIHYGHWSWRELSEIEREDPETYRRWFAQPHLVRIPGGDSLQDLIARTANGLRHLLDHHAQDTIVVVAHDSANRALLMQLLDMPISAYWKVRQDPACLNEIDFMGERVQVGRVNETAHLADLADPS